MNNNEYKRLPGRGVTWTGPSRVWLGQDHVLLVLGRSFFETYRRFFFNDIQAVVVRRTHTGKTWTAIWLIGLVFFAAIAAVVADRIAQAVLLGLATPFAIALIINLLLGPTCACHIRTAVQTERLPAVSRLRTAREFLARLEPLIVTTQGGFPPGESVASFAEFQAQPLSSVAAPPVVG